MALYLEYIQGADLYDATFEWRDTSANLIDFSSGWTFALKVGLPGQAAQFSKSSGITGASTSPNVTIAWATSGELNTLAAGTWYGQIKATRNSDSKDRFLQFEIRIDPAIT